VNINPDAKTLFIAKCPVSDLGWNLPVLRVALRNENSGIRPTPVAIDNAELARDIRMWLDQEGLEQPLIGCDLSL